MTDYIDREAFLAFLKSKEYSMATVKTIREYPAADVAPVVRCDDCCRRYENDNGEYVCGMSDVHCGDDDFCSYGERKDEEEAT